MKAAIDIGTNSVRLLVADFSAPKPRVVEAGLRITRLGEGLDASGRIKAAAVERTAAAVREFAGVARRRGADPIVYGTLALREAVNGPEASGFIEREAGIVLKTLSGQEEAEVTYRGVAMGHQLGPADIVLDIGGGSTEFSRSMDERIISHSLALGSVRQSERRLKSDPPSGAEIEGLRSEITELVRAGAAAVTGEELQRVKRLFGVAGSVTQVVALELEMTRYDPEVTDGFILTVEMVRAWSDRLARMTSARRRDLPGMVPERADTVLAGTIILEETLRTLELPELVVSEYDSLWGALSLAM